MQSDLLGNPVSRRSEAALAAIDDFVGGFLAYEARAANILGAAEAHPDDGLINAYAGLLWMLLESPDGPKRAAKHLARAEAAAAGAHPREAKATALLAAWTRDDIPLALRLCDEIAEAFPHDLTAVKIGQYLDFNLGRLPQMLRAGERAVEANPTLAYAHGMAAFGYEQCHLLEEAEAAAREALRRQRKEPWAQHALAHVMVTQGRIDEGADFLESVRDTWVGLNSFMVTHLWWHLGLFQLSQGRFAETLDSYDRNMWGVARDYSQDQIGAVSMLARLELAGVDVGGRWADVAADIARRGADVTQPFLAVQYLYGLARAGRSEADALMTAIRERARTAPEYAGAAWREAAVPLAEGLLAHARGDWRTAEVRITPALASLGLIGGSHAQRDLFEQVRLDAILRGGGWARAQQILELRRAADQDGVPVNRALAKVYEALELPKEAATARARADRTLAAHAARRRVDA